jgi:hypothetical protein
LVGQDQGSIFLDSQNLAFDVADHYRAPNLGLAVPES